MTLRLRCMSVMSFVARSSIYVIVSLSLFLIGCARTPVLDDALVRAADHRIYVVSERWHSSLLVDVADILPYTHHLKSELLPYKHVCFGWGDGDYFTGKDKSLPTATRALVDSQYSALQVLGYYGSALKQIAPKDRTPVAITAEGMKRLAAFIEDSLLIENGAPISLTAYEKNTGVFFQGRDQYSAKNNCNTWVSRALQQSGIPINREAFVRTETVFKQSQAVTRLQEKRGLLPKTFDEKEAERVLVSPL